MFSLDFKLSFVFSFWRFHVLLDSLSGKSKCNQKADGGAS